LKCGAEMDKEGRLTDHLRNEKVVQSQRGKEDPRNNK
jgi:hypothetical protein